MDRTDSGPQDILSEEMMGFCGKLYRKATGKPEDDYVRICNAWKEWCGADIVFLWLCQEEIKQDESEPERIWHLVGFAYDNEYAKPPYGVWYRASNKKTVNEFSARTMQAEFVENRRNWTKTKDGVNFTVLEHDQMKDIPYSSFIAVPLVAPSERDGGKDEVIGSICLHFNAPFKVRIDDRNEVWALHGAVIRRTGNRSTLNWMGRATAQELVRSQQALQKRTLLELNKLAGKWLVASSHDPESSRENYLDALIKTISEIFNIDSIALLYRNAATKDSVALLWTTGVVKTSAVEVGEGNAQLVPRQRWGEITYGKITKQADDSAESQKTTSKEEYEGRTGECFFTGKAIPLPDGLLVGQGDNRLPRTYEVKVMSDGKFDLKNFTDPALILPIPLPPSEETAEGRGKALGVLRFAGHRWNRAAGTNRSFAPVEIQTLEFLAEQIGPVLETMARNIIVEQALATQRHELRNSITMINSLVSDMGKGMGEPSADGKTSVSTYDLWDLKYSGLLARAQVQRLFRDDQENRDLNISHTLLYGHILARVCETVGRRSAEEHKINIRLDHDSCRRLSKVYVDPWYIEQALLNLLMNAVKYGNPGTSIQVSAKEDARGTWISVANEGVGVDDADAERIFESGYRAPKAIARTVGAGLGLAITRLIMRKHGGDVFLDKPSNPAEPSKSTVFTLFLPGSLRNVPP